jgi:hypothetical protein
MGILRTDFVDRRRTAEKIDGFSEIRFNRRGFFKISGFEKALESNPV